MSPKATKQLVYFPVVMTKNSVQHFGAEIEQQALAASKNE